MSFKINDKVKIGNHISYEELEEWTGSDNTHEEIGVGVVVTANPDYCTVRFDDVQNMWAVSTNWLIPAERKPKCHPLTTFFKQTA